MGDTQISVASPCPAIHRIAPNRQVPIQPAMVPDQVFLGLSAGQNLGPPRMRPKKYPAVSEMMMTPISHRTKFSP